MVAAWKSDTLKRGLARRLKGKLASQSNYITLANESGHLVDARELRSSAIWWFESSRRTQLEIVDPRIRQVPANCGLL
jgi:hypothetical protein